MSYRTGSSRRLTSLAVAAAVAVSAAGLLVGCGTQYGGPRSSIPRDVEGGGNPSGTSSSTGTNPQPSAPPGGQGNDSGGGGTR